MTHLDLDLKNISVKQNALNGTKAAI